MSRHENNAGKKPGLQVFHKGLILVIAPLLIEILMISALAYLLQESDRESVREVKLRRCASISAKLISLANELVITAFFAYHGNSLHFIQQFDSDMELVAQKERQLLKNASADPASENAATQLIDSINDLTPLLERIITPAKHGMRILEVSGMMKDLQKDLSAKRDINIERMASVAKIQEKIAEESSQRARRLQVFQFRILAFGFAANLAAGLLLMAFYRFSIQKRLQVVMENTRALAENRPLKPLLKGADEIYQLDCAFHSMDRELREAAERERALFENVSDVISVIDENLCFKKINPASMRSWGYAPEALINKRVSEILPDSERERAEKLFLKAVEMHELSSFELKIKCPDGRELETLWATYYSSAEFSFYCVVHDITERKQIERNKEAFLKLMSSDLLQPLHIMQDDFSTLLGPLKNELSEKARARLDSARKNLGRLLLLVQDLLKLSQTQLEKLDSRKQESQVEELLTRSIQDLEGLARKRNIEFELELKDHAASIYVDPNKIMQVVVNLGSNAIKFSPQNSKVVLSAELKGKFVEIQVQDRGRGVPESHQQQIFEKFQQVESQDGKRQAGTGLGLPICKEIIEEHGGEIGVRSMPDSGSTFWFRVPADQASYEAALAKKQELLALEKKLSTLPEQQTALLQAKSVGGKLTLTQKGLLLIGVPILFELVFVASFSAVLLQTEQSRKEESLQRQVASSAYKLIDSYLSNSIQIVHTKNFEGWLVYDRTCSDMIAAGEKLKKLLARDPYLKRLYAPAEKVHEKVVSNILRGRKLVGEGYTRERVQSVLPDRIEIWAKSGLISKRLGKLIDEAEKKEFVNPKKQGDLRKSQGLLLALGLASNVLLSLFLARFFSKDITSRLALQADNALRLGRDLSLNPVFPGADEIARLDAEFHQTAEKLAEARRKERAILDNSKDLIFVLDSHGQFLSINSEAEDTFGLAKEELLSRSIFDLISQDEREEMKALISGDLSHGISKEFAVLPAQRKPVYLMLSLRRPPEQESIYCIAHDISHRKELEQLKQDFLSVVSHDLRSPLTSIAGTASFIEEGGTGELGAGALALVHDLIVQGERLIELINDLLDLEKFEAGKMQLERKLLDSADLLEKGCALAQSKFPDVEIELGEALENEFVEGDSERLLQALSNIIIYVVEKNPDASIIKVDAIKSVNEINASEENASEKICWRVHDPSKRMSKQAAADIFLRPGFAANKQPGAGEKPGSDKEKKSALSILALSLAGKIVLAHKGKLKVLPGLKGGNLFVIELAGAGESKSFSEI